MNDETKKNLERFLQYVQIDTQSDDASTSTPSASKELNLTKKLAGELEELGIPHEIDEFGRLYGWMKGEEGWDPIGLNAHVDTALECSGANVKPRIIEKYDGGTIVLNETYLLPASELTRFYRERPRASLPLDFIREKGTLIQEGYRPRFDYLPALKAVFLK